MIFDGLSRTFIHVAAETDIAAVLLVDVISPFHLQLSKKWRATRRVRRYFPHFFDFFLSSDSFHYLLSLSFVFARPFTHSLAVSPHRFDFNGRLHSSHFR